MTQQRKVTLAALFVMTVLLAGVSIFITIKIQQNNAAADANASGFGPDATTNKFGSVFEQFAAYPCTEFLTSQRISGLGEKPTIITAVQSTTNNLDTLGALPYLPVSCTYTISGGKTVDFLIHTYDVNSFIDNSADDLYARINVNLGTQLDKQFIGEINSYVPMFYGTDGTPVSSSEASSEGTVCRANLFHSQNDLEYAEVVYRGFADCNSILRDNQLISSIFATRIIIGMSTVNAKF